MAGTKGARRGSAAARRCDASRSFEAYLAERKRRWLLRGAAVLAVIGLGLGLGFGLTGGSAANKPPKSSTTTSSSSTTSTTTTDLAPLSSLGALHPAPRPARRDPRVCRCRQ